MFLLSRFFALVDTVEHILKLADEYQIEVVVERCRRYLHTQKLYKTNALRFLILAQRYKFENLRAKCYPVLKKLEVKCLRCQPRFGEMDEESYRKVVTARLEESEEILPGLQSLVWGLLRYSVEQKPGYLVCEEHFKCNSYTEKPRPKESSRKVRKDWSVHSLTFGDWENDTCSQQTGGCVAIDAKTGYVTCPSCKTMYDRVMKCIENTNVQGKKTKDIIEKLITLS